jgi:protocatechuate 3,4-dioxygenase beta subunit
MPWWIALLVLASVTSPGAKLEPMNRGTAPASRLTVAKEAEPGERLVLEVEVVDGDGKPVAGARAHVYQTDATGQYTRERAMDEPHARLAGWVTSDRAGRFELHTIRPGAYPRALRLGGRDRHIPAHIHVDVSAEGHAERRFQVVFADDPQLVDTYWQKWVKDLDEPVVPLTREGTRWHGRATFVLR